MNANVLQIGGVPIQSVSEAPARMSVLLWGTTGSGKTTLSCTAPGRKLLINFDPDGPQSVRGIPNVSVADFSGALPSLVEQFKNVADPLGLSKVIEQFDTIIVDSLSTVGDMTLNAGINKSKLMSKSANTPISIEMPGLQSYQIRNALLMELVKNLLSFTAKHNKNLICIAHEAAPEKDDQGSIIGVTILLGGQLVELVGLKFSEIWNVYDNTTLKKKLILVRPARMRKPCKTRMFQTTKSGEFEWNYDPETHEGGTIEQWFNQYRDNKFQKIPLPT